MVNVKWSIRHKDWHNDEGTHETDEEETRNVLESWRDLCDGDGEHDESIRFVWLVKCVLVLGGRLMRVSLELFCVNLRLEFRLLRW